MLLTSPLWRKGKVLHPGSCSILLCFAQYKACVPPYALCILNEILVMWLCNQLEYIFFNWNFQWQPCDWKKYFDKFLLDHQGGDWDLKDTFKQRKMQKTRKGWETENNGARKEEEKKKRETEGKLCSIIWPRSVTPKSSIQFANSSKISQKPWLIGFIEKVVMFCIKVDTRWNWYHSRSQRNNFPRVSRNLRKF